MDITPEYLGVLRQRAESQRAALVIQVHEADGVLALIDALIARLSEVEPAGESGADSTPTPVGPKVIRRTE